MAVVQISKIQVRRGQKNSNSGVPQLSSAEFAWAVDTQELFIGNGSIAEGAPYVGNTKILTEHDNILELASSYRFSPDNIITSQQRPLQQKLDEYVSVLDFGAIGDGETDETDAFERAFLALFRNVDSRFRKVLYIPNGNYIFSRDLIIPAGKLNPTDIDEYFTNVEIRGETKLGTVLHIGAFNIRFISATGTQLAGFTSTDRPRNVKISDLTIKRTTGQTVLSGLSDSVFENIKFLGTYTLPITPLNLNLDTTPSAVFWENTILGTRVNNLIFDNCDFESVNIAVRSMKGDPVSEIFDTEIKFKKCKFYENDTAIYIKGVSGQGNLWKIDDCEFEKIAVQVFKSTNGTGTLITNCKFIECGNEISLGNSPVYPFISFGEKDNNLVLDSKSDRQQLKSIGINELTSMIPEVSNSSKTSFVDRIEAVIDASVDGIRALTVFSSESRYIIIDYFLKISEYSRVGQILITLNDDLTDPSLSDHYQYSPILTTEPGGSIMTNFEFSVQSRDQPGTSVGNDTLVLYYTNPAPAPAGTISFSVSYGV